MRSKIIRPCLPSVLPGRRQLKRFGRRSQRCLSNFAKRWFSGK